MLFYTVHDQRSNSQYHILETKKSITRTGPCWSNTSSFVDDEKGISILLPSCKGNIVKGACMVHVGQAQKWIYIGKLNFPMGEESALFFSVVTILICDDLVICLAYSPQFAQCSRAIYIDRY